MIESMQKQHVESLAEGEGENEVSSSKAPTISDMLSQASDAEVPNFLILRENISFAS